MADRTIGRMILFLSRGRTPAAALFTGKETGPKLMRQTRSVARVKAV